MDGTGPLLCNILPLSFPILNAQYHFTTIWPHHNLNTCILHYILLFLLMEWITLLFYKLFHYFNPISISYFIIRCANTSVEPFQYLKEFVFGIHHSHKQLLLNSLVAENQFLMHFHMLTKIINCNHCFPFAESFSVYSLCGFHKLFIWM